MTIQRCVYYSYPLKVRKNLPYSGNNKTPSLQYSGKHFAHTQILTERRRKALEMTDTLLKLIAKAAIMGLRRIPKNG